MSNKRLIPITVPHVAWGAPRIQTHRTDDCTTPECSRAEWSGENTYSGGAARCVAAPHWDAVLKEAERVGWPLKYRRDLYVHDRATLGMLDPSVPFVWLLREHGTHLSEVTYVDGVGHDAAHFAESVPQIFRPQVCHVYTWDGRYLHRHQTPATAAHAVRMLRVRYEDSLKRRSA
jgi:hypothetical protein